MKLKSLVWILLLVSTAASEVVLDNPIARSAATKAMVTRLEIDVSRSRAVLEVVTLTETGEIASRRQVTLENTPAETNAAGDVVSPAKTDFSDVALAATLDGEVLQAALARLLYNKLISMGEISGSIQ